MKPHVEMIEGPEAFKRFESAMTKILAVPHDEIKKRIADHKKMAALNPRKRGPKPKQKYVSPDAAV